YGIAANTVDSADSVDFMGGNTAAQIRKLGLYKDRLFSPGIPVQSQRSQQSQRSSIIVIFMAAVVLIPAFMFAVVMVFTAAPVFPATIIMLVAVTVVAMVAVIPVASPPMTRIPILVAELECIPVIRADAREPCSGEERSVVTVRAASEIICLP